jgi:hypothetical protein
VLSFGGATDAHGESKKDKGGMRNTRENKWWFRNRERGTGGVVVKIHRIS